MTFPALRGALAALLLALALPAGADEVQVAVAANFAAAAQKVGAAFEHDTGHTLKMSFGATGKFYSQIAAGAPFDVLLAADESTPARLVSEGLAIAATRRTYAVGHLVLWSADPALVDPAGDVLRTGHWRHLAIADPKVAPYGQAATQALEKLGLADAVQPRLVTAESIGQAFQFVSTGNAELGFVALGQVQPPDGSRPPGSMWRVPDALHTPLKQDAVVIAATRVQGAARAFVDYLAGERARALIQAFGYGG